MNCPMPVATAPSAINTTLNPRMNITEFSSTERLSLRLADCNWSTLVPEISETYPGTSGKMQGERKDKSPARNTAIGSGRLDIRLYLTARGSHAFYGCDARSAGKLQSFYF